MINREMVRTGPPYHLVTWWLLMAPLLFFAVGGTVRFDASFKNNLLSNGLQAIGDPRQQYLSALIMLECVLVLGARLSNLLKILLNDKLFLSLGLLALVSSAWSEDPKHTLVTSVYALINIGFAVYLSYRFTPERQMQIFMMVGWFAIILSIVAALLFPEYGIDHRGTHSTGDWFGIFIHKNACAVMVTYLVTPVLCLSSAACGGRVWKTLYLASAVFLVAMSQSRTGWIILAMMFAFGPAFGLLQRLAANEKVVVTILGFVGLGVGAALVANFYTDILTFLGKDATLTGRTVIFATIFESILKRPLLGYGYSAFFVTGGESSTASLLSGQMLPTVDNGYLGLWLDLGIVGLIVFAFTLIRAFRDIRTCLRLGSPTPAVKWYISVVLLAFVSNTVERMIMLPNYLAWMMYVVACLGLARTARQLRKGNVTS